MLRYKLNKEIIIQNKFLPKSDKFECTDMHLTSQQIHKILNIWPDLTLYDTYHQTFIYSQ